MQTDHECQKRKVVCALLSSVLCVCVSMCVVGRMKEVVVRSMVIQQQLSYYQLFFFRFTHL